MNYIFAFYPHHYAPRLYAHIRVPFCQHLIICDSASTKDIPTQQPPWPICINHPEHQVQNSTSTKDPTYESVTTYHASSSECSSSLPCSLP